MSESKEKPAGDSGADRNKSEEAGYFPALIIESLADSVVGVDLNTVITIWNKSAEQLYGFAASEVIGKPLTMLTLSGDLGELTANIESVRDSGTVKVYETERVDKDGHRTNLLVTLSPVRDNSGQIIGVSTVARDITENKKTAEELYASDYRYRTLFNSIDQGFCIIEMLFDANEKAVDYRFTEVNPVFEKMSGIPNNKALSEKTARELIPNLEDKWIEIYGKVALTGESVRFEENSAALNRWFDVYSFRIGGKESRKVALLFNDISQHRLTKGQLQRQRDFTSAITTSVGEGIYALDGDGLLAFMNPAAEKILGWKESELLGRDMHEVIHFQKADGAHLSEDDCTLMEVLKSERSVRREDDVFTLRDGSVIPVAYTSSPIVTDGKIAGAVITFRDITERKQAEQEREQLLKQLETERSRLAFLFASAPAFVATVRGPEHIFELTNPAYLQLIGHRDVIGKSVREALPEVEGQGFFEILDNVFRTGEAFIGKELPIEIQREPNGAPEKRFVDFVYQPIFEADKSVSGIFAHGIDITEQVEARRQAEFANRLKDEFLATLSHELRTPLNAVLGWSQVLQTRNLGEVETRKALATIERSARAQNQLIDDLLDVSRIITGKLRLDVRAVDLSGVITTAVDAARPGAEAKNIRLQTLLDPQAGPISGDPDRLQQVVWNLLSNAVKFTPKGGRVQIRLERVNSHIEIVVSDTGKGIEAEFLPFVFDRFRQSDGSMTRRHGGLGLGLAIVRQLVELHGGSVSVSSDGNEQGATFTVNLPLLPVRTKPPGDVPRAHPAAETGALRDCPPELSDLRVLLVDDEADSRDLLTLMLDSCGAQVTAADSAAEAFGLIQSERFDVVISDIGMPEEDGFSLIGKIRELSNEKGGDVPAIALTAYARAEDRVKALRSGFQMHITKPVEPSELVAVVANLAGRMRNPKRNESE